MFDLKDRPVETFLYQTLAGWMKVEDGFVVEHKNGSETAFVLAAQEATLCIEAMNVACAQLAKARKAEQQSG
eukprot:COSAG04_NODE_5501_length_1593_cov_3.897659_1_plen_71_part_10